MSKAFYQDFKLGILGGGQLGRMLIRPAMDFNVGISILDADPEAPSKNYASHFVEGSITDADTVYEFGKSCDMLTIEIENVNTEALERLHLEGKKVYPQPSVISIIQDKRRQKTFYQERGIPTADFILVEEKQEVLARKDFLPAVNKLGKAGYDGRGVQVLREEADLDKAFDAPGIVEKLVDFEHEISVIVARSTRGEIKTFPTVELVFHPEHNLVEYLIAPTGLAENILKTAEEIAKKVITELDMVGLLAVEMFVTKEGEVLVNEVAPRPHNSGHQTIEANVTSQYEQHLRAILGLPLGDTALTAHTAMVNLLGAEGHQGLAQYEGLEEVLAQRGIHVHLYGKKVTKPYRKMGHVTIIASDKTTLTEKVHFVKKHLKVIA